MFWGTALVFSTVAGIPTNSARGSLYLHILANTCRFLYFFILEEPFFHIRAPFVISFNTIDGEWVIETADSNGPDLWKVHLSLYDVATIIFIIYQGSIYANVHIYISYFSQPSQSENPCQYPSWRHLLQKWSLNQNHLNNSFSHVKSTPTPAKKGFTPNPLPLYLPRISPSDWKQKVYRLDPFHLEDNFTVAEVAKHEFR